MTEAINKFSFFASFWEAASDLGDTDRLALYDAMCAYAFTGEEPDFTGIMGTVWKLMKPNIDSSVKGQRTGSRGGRPAKENPSEGKPKPPVKKTKNPPFSKSETDKDKDMDMDGDMDMDREEFVPLERTNSSLKGAKAATAAAKAAPPPRKDKVPICPMCEVEAWKNTQTGKWHCPSCQDAFTASKVGWR